MSIYVKTTVIVPDPSINCGESLTEGDDCPVINDERRKYNEKGDNILLQEAK